jgi:phage recombination protein Bet
METALAVKDDFSLSITDVKKYIAPTATDKELFMFMGIAKSYGLNPMKREIHFVKRKQKQADGSWIEIGSSIVGYEVYLKRAERTGKLDGWKCWIEKDQIGEKAVIEIKRKDQSTPIRWEVYRKEFDTEKSTWGKMPTFMLKKVAIAQGFRLAFPDDLGGMPYIPEEMPHDKGGGTSETLPKTEVVDTPVEDVPPLEPPIPTDAGQSEYPEFDAPALEKDEVMGSVESIQSKAGETKGKPWTRYDLTISGQRYSTFSDTLADIARTAQQGEKQVKIRYNETERGRTIRLLEAA